MVTPPLPIVVASAIAEFDGAMTMMHFGLLRKTGLALALTGLLLTGVQAAEPAAKTVRLEPQRDVGGGLLRPKLSCFGALPPTVILDTSGEPASLWTRVVPLLRERSRVCVWNHGAPLSAGQDASKLHEALVLAGESPPYLRVAQGRGTANVAAFALRYPQHVAGLLLVDAEPFPAHTVFDPMLPIAVLSSAQAGDAAWQDQQAGLTAATTQTMQLLAEGPQGSLPMFAPDVVATGLDWLLRLARTEALATEAAANP